MAPLLDQALSFSKRVEHVFITADAGGTPYIASAGGMVKCGPESIRLSDWFCPEAVGNWYRNKPISLAIWDKDADAGYHLIGCLAEPNGFGVINSPPPNCRGQRPLPLLVKQLCIRVETIFDFSGAPDHHVERTEGTA